LITFQKIKEREVRKMRKITAILVCLLLVVSVLGASAVVLGKRPPKPPEEEEKTAEGYETQITDELEDQGYPAIFGDKIVWSDSPYSGIFLYSITTGVATQLTFDQYRRAGPVIHEDRIVYILDYISGMGSETDIYMYYLGEDGIPDTEDDEEYQITTDPANDWSPDIYGDKIVFIRRMPSGRGEIFMYDLSVDTDGDDIPNYRDSDDDGDGVESVTLDGSGSYDSDGTISSYLWQEGTTTLGTEKIINATFDVTGSPHTVTLTVTDSDGLTDTDEVVITVKEPVTGTMYVASISFSGKKAGRNLFLYTTVEVFDNNDNPLAGAMVEMTLTGPGGSWNFAGNTLEDGTIMFTLKTKQYGLYTATVTNIPDGETEKSCTLNSDGTISPAGSVASNSLDKPIGNYPNPFNPETNIEYGIKETGFVSIKIYNVMGQVVRTLVNEVQSAGVYTVVWNGRDEQGRELSSGIYYGRLVAGEQSAILKMLFLK